MSPISFQDVARLVNRIPGTRIDVDTPRLLEADQYAVYAGSVSSSGFTFEFVILYLYASATKDGVRGARAFLGQVSDKSKVRAVFAPSITQSIVEDVRILGIQCISLGDYFLSFMRQQTEAYISRIKQIRVKEDYIDPQIETPAGFLRKTPNPIIDFMLTHEKTSPVGEVAVLLGEPGQGKTHMSKYLAVQLTARSVIPIYVQSEQWAEMRSGELSSVWKTIVASFGHFDAPIGWAEGAEREFVRVSLRLGVFRLIFDGFDEYVLWNRGTIEPCESLQEILNLAQETGTTLCITSRTSFWKSEIIEADQVIVGRERLFDFTISPFDVNHARNYFVKRFGGNDPEVHASVQIFELLRQDSSNDAKSFVGRGFFLSLIADLVNRGFRAEQVGTDGRTRLQWITEALCQREQTRQRLPMDAAMQLAVLRDFAEITAKGEPCTTDTLRLALATTAELDPQQLDQLIKRPAKLKDHPLIRFTQASSSLSYTQDQIEYMLLAERIIEICESNDGGRQLAALLNNEKFLKRLQADVATLMVQQIFEPVSIDEALGRCKEIIAAISRIGTQARGREGGPTGCHAFAGQLALVAAGRAYARGASRQERTNALLNLLPAGQLVGLQFVGSMTGFDLRGLIITDCHFDTVTFTSCRFSSETQFVNCRFTELRTANCEQFGLVNWDSTNKYDEASRRLIDAEMASAGQRTYGEDNLLGDLDYLIRRFLPRETSGFKNIEERNLTRGLIGHSLHKDVIVDSFKRAALTANPVAGVPVYSVNETVRQAFIFYLGNGVLTGELATLKNDLRRKFGLAS